MSKIIPQRATSLRRPKIRDTRNPEEVAKLSNIALMKAKKRYRSMRTFTLPYEKYYEAQLSKDKYIYHKKKEEVKGLCAIGERVAAEMYVQRDKSRCKEIAALFETFMLNKIKVKDMRYDVKERKFQLVAALEELSKKRYDMSRKHVVDKRYGSVQKLLNWIPRYEDRLNVAIYKKNKVIAKVSECRKEVASILQARIMQLDKVEKTLLHLARGKIFLNDILDQALAIFKQREDSLNSYLRAKEQRAIKNDKSRKSLIVLEIQAHRANELLQFHTIKSQRRMIQRSDEEILLQNILEQKEQSMQQYLNDTVHYILQVGTFFRSLDMNMIAKHFQENWIQCFHILSLLITEGGDAANFNFVAQEYFNQYLEYQDVGKKGEIDNETELKDLEAQITYLTATADIYKSKLNCLLKEKETLFSLFERMLKTLPIPGWMYYSERWDTLETLQNVLRKIERIAMHGLRSYRATHSELYYKPYTIDKHGKLVVTIPKDRRLKQKAISILSDMKKMHDVFRKPVTPCFLCIQDDRANTFWQVKDTVRTKKYFEDRIGWLMKNEVPPFIHSSQKCSSAKPSQMATHFHEREE